MRTLWTVASKDLRSEMRGKEVAPAMGMLTLAVVFLLAFVLPAGGGRAPVPLPIAGSVAIREIAAAFLWTGMLFAAIVGFGRTASSEREGGKLDSLVLSPADPALLFMGKALSNFILLSTVALALLPAFIIFFDLQASLLIPEVFPVLALANAGLAAAGSLFGAASQYARAREVVLPLLLFPSVLPALLAATRLTAALTMQGAFGSETRWFILLGAYDVIFLALGALTFEYVIRE